MATRIRPSARIRHAFLMSLMGILLCGAFLNPLEGGDNSKRLLARFESEARQAWRIVEAADEWPGVVKMSSIVKTYRSGKLTTSDEKSAMIHRRPGCFLFQPAKSIQGILTLEGGNPDYAFSLSKSDGKPDWRLGSIRLKGRKEYVKVPLAFFEYLRPNGYAFVPLLGNLSEFADTKEFRAVRAEPKESSIVRIHFETAFFLTNRRISVTGFMDLDPTNSWALTRSEYESSGPSLVKVVKLYAASHHNGYRPCESWEATSRFPKGDVEMRQETKFETVDVTEPKLQEFYVSAYQLPEPMGIQIASPSRWYLWFGAAGVASLAFGLLLRRIVRRRWEHRTQVDT